MIQDRLVKEDSRMLTCLPQHMPRFVAGLSSFIRIPSVSAGTQHRQQVHHCAKWLAAHLTSTGLENVQLIPSEKYPVVYGDWLHAPGKPVLLIYGHYDVQPADPLGEWKHDPFSGLVKDGYIQGRGSSDDKGQLFAHIKAIELFLKQERTLPINVKCIFEGEEEIGSPGLKKMIQRLPGLFRSDACVVSDMSIPSVHQPAITCSLRGMLSLELEISGQQQDLHSGTFGGVIYNPAQALCEMLASLHDRNGKVLIPGFYDTVKVKSIAQRQYMQANGRNDATILKEAGARCGWGEKGFSLYERIVSRPSLSINGITSGYQGDGPKSVIPSKAKAKLSFRLAQGQDPAHIEQLFRAHIHSITPSCLTARIKTAASAKPVQVATGHPFIKAAARAYQKGFGRQTIFTGSGGTIPIVHLLYEHLNIPVIMMGFALPDDNPHGPNEKFSIDNFQKAIKTSFFFMKELGL